MFKLTSICMLMTLSPVVMGGEPKDARYFYNAGIKNAQKGDFDAAIMDFTEAIRLDPKDAGAFYNRGVAYDQKRDFDAGIKDLTEAIRLDPNYAKPSLCDRGLAHYW